MPVAVRGSCTAGRVIGGFLYFSWFAFLTPFLLVYSLLLLSVLFLFTFDIHRAVRMHNVVFGRTVVALSWPWIRYRIHGREHARGLKRAIIVVNHSTSVDIFFTALLPFTDRIVFVKSWVTRMFYLGPFVRLARYVNTQDSDPGDYPKLAADPRNGNCSFQMYPEGTRSRDGSLGRFHSGAFWFALQTGLPVLPVYIGGLHGFPSSRFPFVFPVRVGIHILPPVDPAPWQATGDHKGMRKAVRALYNCFEGEGE